MYGRTTFFVSGLVGHVSPYCFHPSFSGGAKEFDLKNSTEVGSRFLFSDFKRQKSQTPSMGLVYLHVP